MKQKLTKPKEIKYYGLHACQAIWERRPQDVIRLYLHASQVVALKPILKWCAEQKKAYHIVPEEDLARVSESIHHEGVCLLAKEPARTAEQELFAHLAKEGQKQCILYLDGVQNPHNLGSILRTCAHFGIAYVLGEEGKLPALSPSACRIAKGGAERVKWIALARPEQTLRKLKAKGFSLIGTSSHKGSSLYRFAFPARTVLAIGSESSGVGKTVLAQAADNLQIPGSGFVESLNVSVATSLCLGEYARQHAAFVGRV